MTDLTLINESGTSINCDKEVFEHIIKIIAVNEDIEFAMIEAVYVTPERILSLNNKYLSKNYITDIITFHYHDINMLEEVEATLFMCTDRIVEQAEEIKVDISDELRRVFIHGLLHLCGYEDETDSEKREMEEKENYYLNLTADA